MKRQDEDIIFFAFRYALGRRTGVVGTVVDHLKEHWSELADHTQVQIKREIKIAIREKRAGMSCDVKNWKEIIEL